jgi:hypothetical protein
VRENVCGVNCFRPIAREHHSLKKTFYGKTTSVESQKKVREVGDGKEKEERYNTLTR